MLGAVDTALVEARAAASFDPDRLALIAALEGDHFWFTGRRALVTRILDRHLDHVTVALEIGCGTGSFLPELARRADRVIGLDPLAPEGDVMVRGEAERLPFERESFDLVVALDVLEHVDDSVALAEMERVLRPGGLAVATVPACPSLWSARDDLAAHRRRYRRPTLVRLLEASGLRVEETAFYQFFLFPLVVATRIVARRRPETTGLEERPHRIVNRAFAAVNAFEVRVGARVRWPWGSTLAVAARKPRR